MFRISAEVDPGFCFARKFLPVRRTFKALRLPAGEALRLRDCPIHHLTSQETAEIYYYFFFSRLQRQREKIENSITEVVN